VTSRVRVFPTSQLNFFVNLLDVGYNGAIQFFGIFLISSDVCMGQFRISIDKHVEIHLCWEIANILENSWNFYMTIYMLSVTCEKIIGAYKITIVQLTSKGCIH
jgi:hypothetical protein